jgi:hypothetical protein
MSPKILFIFALFAPILMLAAGALPRAMTQLPKLIYAAFLIALLCAGVGVFAASAWHGEAAVEHDSRLETGRRPGLCGGVGQTWPPVSAGLCASAARAQ